MSTCSTVVTQARFTEAVWLGAGTLRVPLSRRGCGALLARRSKAQLCDALCLHSGDEAVKKPIASEANRSLLVRQESMHGAMEKQIRYCNTEERKANLEVTGKRTHHWVSALVGTLWCMKKD